jgi:tyrosinase
MREPISAAFDPLFWLHHAFVDYLFFLWQANFPSVWVSSREEAGGKQGELDTGQVVVDTYQMV